MESLREVDAAKAMIGGEASLMTALEKSSCPCHRIKDHCLPSKMSFQQLSAMLREIRSKMPRVTSESAYAQMDHLMGRRTSTVPKTNGQHSMHSDKG